MVTALSFFHFCYTIDVAMTGHVACEMPVPVIPKLVLDN